MKTEGKSTWGGKRDGSGRKPRMQFEARELFNMAVDERWDRILSKLDSLILRADAGTLRFLIEQRIGKAAITVVPTSDEKPTPLLINFDSSFKDNDD